MNEVLNKLINNGYEAFIVGGYVRDLLLGKSSFDIDICTNADINTIKKLFNGGKSYDKYFSIHFSNGKYNYEITSYRKELEYENNKPIKIELCNNLYEDLLRRDFTINTICIDKDNNIIDMLDGKKDLDNRVIKVVGEVNNKFLEDKRRILRAIRFASVLDFEFNEEIKIFLKNNGKLLSTLNKEYIKSELDIIFNSNSYKFFDIVSMYNLKEYLHINYDNIVKSGYYGLWAQIECDFNFNSRDSKIINNIKKLVKKGNITKIDIYNYGVNICNEASIILNIDISKLIDINIKSRSDIDIDTIELRKYIDNKDINEVYKLIEENIINDNLLNNKKSIIEFIIKCYNN